MVVKRGILLILFLLATLYALPVSSVLDKILSDSGISVDVIPENIQQSVSNVAFMSINTEIPVVVSSDGITALFDYKFNRKYDKWQVEYCNKNYENNFMHKSQLEKVEIANELSAVKVSEEKGDIIDLPSSVNMESECGSFEFEGQKGDSIKIGEHSTIIQIMDNNINFIVTPEYKSCNYLQCESQIIIENKNNYSISINSSDFYVEMGDYANSLSFDYLNADYEIVRADVNEGIDITIEPNDSKVFYLNAFGKEENIMIKYNVTFDYLGSSYSIDPYFNTTNISSIVTAFYKFEEGSGNFSYDSVYSNTLTNKGNYSYNPSLGSNGTGLFSMYYNGSTGYSMAVSNDKLRLYNDSSIALWVKPNITSLSAYTALASKSTGINSEYWFGMYGNNPYFQYRTHQNSSQAYTFSSLNLTNNTWQFLVLTIKKNTPTSFNFTVYLNDNKVQSQSGSTGLWSKGDGDFNLGRQAFDLAYYYKGSMDNVIIFNKTLIAGEVYQLYNESIANCFVNWIANYNSCNINNTMQKYYLDSNNCNTNASLPVDNGTYQFCNYCSESLSDPFYIPDECPSNGTQLRHYIDYNYSVCCALTGLFSDCSINYAPYANQSVNCSYLKTDITLYIDSNPYLGSKIDIYAQLNASNISNLTKCWSYVKSENGILQINPQKKIYSDSLIFSNEEETREYFTPIKGIINGYYTDENLIADKQFVLGVKCNFDNGTTILGEAYINPKYSDAIINKANARGVWFADNASILVPAGILFVIILMFVFIMWYVR